MTHPNIACLPFHFSACTEGPQPQEAKTGKSSLNCSVPSSKTSPDAAKGDESIDLPLTTSGRITTCLTLVVKDATLPTRDKATRTRRGAMVNLVKLYYFEIRLKLDYGLERLFAYITRVLMFRSSVCQILKTPC
mmetsp:Transcript_55375/g.64766  ORF Transcript_55375/g.64766 Transcript_55375/m.64766 type:complete len:134 (-) Transcript_55375:17-418(-)